MILLEVGFGGRALGHDQRLAVEVLHVLDRRRIRCHNAERDLHVRLREVDLLGAFRGLGEVRERDVHLVRREHVHTRRRIDRRVHGLHSEAVGERLGELDVVAGVLAIFVHIAERCLVGEHRHTQLARLLDLVERARLGVRAVLRIAGGGSRLARRRSGRTAGRHSGDHHHCGSRRRDCLTQLFEK